MSEKKLRTEEATQAHNDAMALAVAIGGGDPDYNFLDILNDVIRARHYLSENTEKSGEKDGGD